MSSREHCLFEPRSAPYLASLLLFSRHLSPADSISQAFLPSLAFSSIHPLESSGYILEDRKDGFIFFQASTLFCAFLPLWLHLSPGCPTLQGSSSSWTASISSSALHHPILRCSSCLLCYPLSRCLTCLLGAFLTVPSASSHHLITWKIPFLGGTAPTLTCTRAVRGEKAEGQG